MQMAGSFQLTPPTRPRFPLPQRIEKGRELRLGPVEVSKSQGPPTLPAKLAAAQQRRLQSCRSIRKGGIREPLRGAGVPEGRESRVEVVHGLSPLRDVEAPLALPVRLGCAQPAGQVLPGRTSLKPLTDIQGWAWLLEAMQGVSSADHSWKVGGPPRRES